MKMVAAPAPAVRSGGAGPAGVMPGRRFGSAVRQTERHPWKVPESHFMPTFTHAPLGPLKGDAGSGSSCSRWYDRLTAVVAVNRKSLMMDSETLNSRPCYARVYADVCVHPSAGLLLQEVWLVEKS